jgi:cold-inducible RNA-binding protein
MESRVNIYVGNISRDVTQTDLMDAFKTHGQVATVNIITDKFTGESRGFGFVEMPTKTEALAAIAGLNGKEFQGRTLTVNEARPRTEGGGRGGFDRDRGSGGGGGGGRRPGGGGGGGGGGRRSW